MGADGGKIRQCNLQTVAVDDLNEGKHRAQSVGEGSTVT